MSRVTQNELKEYYAEVSAAVICSGKKKKAFMAELQSDVEAFISENTEAGIEDVRSCFGTAESIAQSFLGNGDAAEIRKKTDIKKLLLGAVVAALLIYLAFVVISLIDVHTEAHGYIKEGIMMIKPVFRGGVI